MHDRNRKSRILTQENKRSMILNPMFTKQNLGTPMGNEKKRRIKRHFNTKLV